MILALTLAYLSPFNPLLTELDPDSSIVVAKKTRHNLIFLFFWGGVYSEDGMKQWVHSVYPFYLLMLLAILERVSQRWINDRFGCSEAQIAVFKEIETKSRDYVDAALRKERQKHKQNNLPLRRQMTVEERMTFLQKRTFKSLSRSVTGVSASTRSFNKKNKIITLE